MKINLALALSLSLSIAPFAASAQDAAQAPLTIAAPAAVPSDTLLLAANTPLTVRVNQELNTRRNNEGDTFFATVATDVVQDGYVVIPAGSRVIGSITWLTRKGAFGKSGKMDISFTAVEVGGVRVPVVGTFRQEGEGNTVATVGAVVAVGVFGAFVTGRSGVVPAGRELEIRTRDPLRVALRTARSAPAMVAVAAPAVTASVSAAPVASAPAAATRTYAPQPVPAPHVNAGVRVE